MKDPLKISFGSATPVFMEDNKTIKEYLFHIRLGEVKYRMCFLYDCAYRTIVSYTPITREISSEQRVKLLNYFKTFVGKRELKEYKHLKLTENYDQK